MKEKNVLAELMMHRKITVADHITLKMLIYAFPKKHQSTLFLFLDQGLLELKNWELFFLDNKNAAPKIHITVPPQETPNAALDNIQKSIEVETGAKIAQDIIDQVSELAQTWFWTSAKVSAPKIEPETEDEKRLGKQIAWVIKDMVAEQQEGVIKEDEVVDQNPEQWGAPVPTEDISGDVAFHDTPTKTIGEPKRVAKATDRYTHLLNTDTKFMTDMEKAEFKKLQKTRKEKATRQVAMKDIPYLFDCNWEESPENDQERAIHDFNMEWLHQFETDKDKFLSQFPEERRYIIEEALEIEIRWIAKPVGEWFEYFLKTELAAYEDDKWNLSMSEKVPEYWSPKYFEFIKELGIAYEFRRKLDKETDEDNNWWEEYQNFAWMAKDPTKAIKFDNYGMPQKAPPLKDRQKIPVTLKIDIPDDPTEFAEQHAARMRELTKVPDHIKKIKDENKSNQIEKE